MSQETITLAYDYISQTESSIRICDDVLNGEDAEFWWVPKSVIESPGLSDIEDLEAGESVELEIMTWWAEAEGLV